MANVGGTLATEVQVVVMPGSALADRTPTTSAAQREAPLAPCAWGRSRPAA